MTNPSIYDYRDARDFLREVLEQKQRKNASFSVRAWARQMGLPHHALLSMTLNKKRKLRGTLTSRVREAIGLSGSEARYFEMLVAYNNADTAEEKEFYERLLRELSPQDRPFQELALDAIRLASRWVHSAILEMTELKDFHSDSQWIASRLGNSVTPLEVDEAIGTLLRLGLIERQDGKLKKTSGGFTTSNDVPNEYIRSFHRQMIEKATHALANQPVQHREIRAATVAIRTDQLPKAKQMLRDFTREFIRTMNETMSEQPQMTNATADEVYQLNLQLFSLTDLDTEKCNHEV